ncbi:hypothetical protein EVAR_98188_1 [Eumeta japonica]|uniref:Uncharacterized protein n=1 Tax=Eumeta variegata TaxID=151549 RepID=A0A4C2A273_EUMVA|nr:hypothetical protein EVAR_98188_1 [Eumeta japonica]
MESNICAGRAETSRGWVPEAIFPEREKKEIDPLTDASAEQTTEIFNENKGKTISQQSHRTRRRDAISAGGDSEGDARNASHIVLPDSLMSFISRYIKHFMRTDTRQRSRVAALAPE